MKDKNLVKKILMALFLFVLLFLFKSIKFESKIDMSYQEFLENLDIDNLKKKILFEDNNIFFEPKNSNVLLKSGFKSYDKLRYSVEVPESEIKKLKQMLLNKDFNLEKIRSN